MSIFTRLDRLEQAQKHGIFAKGVDVRTLSDAQLFEVILQDCGLPSTETDVAAHLQHFNVTGELPAGALGQNLS